MNNNYQSKQKKYYNSISSKYDSHYFSDSALKYRYWLYDLFLNQIDLRKMRILDAMCGGGQNTSYFIKHTEDIIAVDISEEQISLFNKRFPKIEAHCCSILETKFNDNTFDLIVTESLHHLHPYVNSCIDEMARMLKPNGYLMIWEPTSGSIFDLLRKFWYKSDNVFFEDNESSISFDRIIFEYSNIFEVKKIKYGGSLAYLLNCCSLQLRIPLYYVNLYAPYTFLIERIFDKMHSKYFSCWFCAILKKCDY